MRKYLLLLILLPTIALSEECQDSYQRLEIGNSIGCGRYGETGQIIQDGKWIETTQNNKLFYERYFDQGKKVGTWKRYYNTGELRRIEKYDENGIDSQRIDYHRNGNLWKEVDYKQGTKEGVYKRYYFDGSLTESGEYLNDKKHGAWKNWDRKGNLRRKSSYSNGRKVGTNLEYDRKDDLVAKTEYKKQDDAIKIEYYPNGEKKIESNYLNGLLDGEQKHYDKFGRMTKMFTYIRGQKEGKFYAYNIKNGNVIRECNYQNNVLNGDCTTYGEDKEIMWVFYYEDGKMKSIKQGGTTFLINKVRNKLLSRIRRYNRS